MASHLPHFHSKPIPSSHGLLSDMPALFLDKVGGYQRLGLDVTAIYQVLNPQSPDSLVEWFHHHALAGGCEYGTDYWFHVTPNLEQLNIFMGLDMACHLSRSQTGPMANKLYQYVHGLRDQIAQALDFCAAPAGEMHQQPISTVQAQWLKNMARAEVERSREHPQTVWTAFQHHFGVNSYLNLPTGRFQEACAYFNGRKRDVATAAAPCHEPNKDEVAPLTTYLRELLLLCELKGQQAQAQRIAQVAFHELEKLLSS